ncbi:MAG: immunoglobulin domain-containing protein, partial [Candidatus Thorarchaeota archaeon]
MKRDAILLILLLLCVVSMPVETDSISVSPRVFDSSKYVISQTEMPIYELITPEVNESFTEVMARSLTPIPEISADETEYGFVVNYLNQTFEIDRRDGSMWYADYDKIWNVALGIEVPTPEYCQTTTDAWLRDKGLLPDNAVLRDIGSTNVSAYNPDADELKTKVLQWHVNYEFMMGDIPVVGETAQISVMIGNNGDRVGFDWKWRDTAPEPYTTSNLIEYESVLDAHGINPEEVVDHRLVYKTDDDESATLLYPMWEVEIIEDDTDELPGIYNLVYLDGTQFNPVVEITTPAHGISMMPGTSITFDCSVSLGTPPYTYQWRSDFDGVLSTSKSFATVSLSEVTKKE